MEENLNDSISVHHFFIYKNDKLVGYTTELSYLKCYIKHRKKLLPEEELSELCNDIINTNISFNQLANKYNISITTVYNINKGTSRKNDKYTYPLRK